MKFLALVAADIVLKLFVAYPVSLIWNAALVPAVAGLSDVGWIQMFAIILMISLMFNTKIEAK